MRAVRCSVPLSAVLELERTVGENEPGYVQSVVLGAGANRIAFGVDEVLREQEGEADGLEFGTTLARKQHLKVHVEPSIGHLRLANLTTPPAL